VSVLEPIVADEDVVLAEIVGRAPISPNKLLAVVARSVAPNEVEAQRAIEVAENQGFIVRADGQFVATGLGKNLLARFVPIDWEVGVAQRSRLVVRSFLTGLPVDRVTRSHLKSPGAVRALFFTNAIFKLNVPLARGPAATVTRCSEYVGCEWARRRLGEIGLADLLRGASPSLKRRLFCMSAGINEFDADVGFRELISSELSISSTSLDGSDSDWILYRAKRAMRHKEPLARDRRRHDDDYPVIADAISDVTSKTLSKWALVSEVFRAVPQGSFQDLVTFKQSLIDLVQQGSLELSPVVVQASVAANDREMSELSFGGRQFHFVRIRRN